MEKGFVDYYMFNFLEIETVQRLNVGTVHMDASINGKSVSGNTHRRAYCCHLFCSRIKLQTSLYENNKILATFEQ